MAKVININIDSRREIDQEIKKVCEEFTTECISAVVEPLSTFMIKLSAVKDIKDDGNESLIDSKEISKIVAQFQEAAEERLKYVVKNLQDYINDKKMEQILIKPIEVNVIEYYKSFYQMVTSNNNNNNNTKIQQPLENTLPSISSISEFINNAINSNTV